MHQIKKFRKQTNVRNKNIKYAIFVKGLYEPTRPQSANMTFIVFKL